MRSSVSHRLASLLLVVIAAAGASAQTRPGTAPAPTPGPAQVLPDALGRTTPRGTVLGFLGAARKGDNELARHYLNTPLSGQAAENLALQLFVVLDTRLSARLTQVSDVPEGSRENPLTPDQERVGSIGGPTGRIDIVVERISRPTTGPIWLFGRATLDAVPAAYAGIAAENREPLPRFRLFEWLVLLLGLPAFYFMTVLLNRALKPLASRLFARGDRAVRGPLPMPARLLLLSAAARWLFGWLPLSLLTRYYLSSAAGVVAIAALVWLIVLVNEEVEAHIGRRIRRADNSVAVSLLRVGRRILDVVVVLAGVVAILRLFGVDPTPLLAGLGVGGIAVALAAQRTLENVIAGASLILDRAVRVGDFLKIGEIEGTVDHIGLRSTRIRTPDRSIVGVPNSQMANMSLETLSARDKFWFHPVVGLRYETTAGQMHLVLDGIRRLLADNPAVDPESVRVRFLRLGAISLDIDVVAYVQARDWPAFLEIQEGLLFGVTAIVEAAGTAIAVPSQATYAAGAGLRPA